jgi:hypothetical protein
MYFVWVPTTMPSRANLHTVAVEIIASETLNCNIYTTSYHSDVIAMGIFASVCVTNESNRPSAGHIQKLTSNTKSKNSQTC